MPEYKIVLKLTEEGYEILETPLKTREWFLNGALHRTDGPAIECSDGAEYWFLNGKRHREDGPAIKNAAGHEEWCLNGNYISLETESNDPKVKILQEYMEIQELLNA